MKKTFLMLALTAAVMASAQSKYLPITAVCEDLLEPFPTTAKAQVINKLNLLMTKNGIASSDPNSQFVLTVFAVPQDKDILAGPPSQIIETMDFSFYIADVINKKVFASAAQTVRGVGTTETRAYLDAIKKMRLDAPEMKNLIEEGQKKIIEYYDAEAPVIIKQARLLSEQHMYEEALYRVMAIPEQCKAYDQALKEASDIFKQYQNYICQSNLALARTAWMAEQNSDGAQKAGEYLATIYPDAGCYDDAMALYKEIKSKVLDDWKFEMKQYQDGIDLEKQRINAMREIGVAYGNHQQPVSTNIGFLR